MSLPSVIILGVPDDDDELLDPRQVADRLHITRRTAVDWIRRGVIPGQNIAPYESRKPIWRVRRSELEAWEARNPSRRGDR